MDNKLIITLSIFALIALVVILRPKVKAKGPGVSIDAQDSQKKNVAKIRGHGNDVKQGKKHKESYLTIKNRLEVDGHENKVDQG